jgi:hypothetical protein
VCLINLQPSTRRVVEEWTGRITGVELVFVTFFHAARKSSIGSVIQGEKRMKTFPDNAIPLHRINIGSNGRYHSTVGLLVPKEPSTCGAWRGVGFRKYNYPASG